MSKVAIPSWYIVLLVIGLTSYIVYEKSIKKVQMLGAEVANNNKSQDAVRVRPSSSSNIKKVSIDRHGNVIPVFKDSTLFSKPGGGYCDITPIKDKEEYFQALENPTVQCKDLQKFDGYYVCKDGFKNKHNCVVMSFGISYIYDYEDLIIDKLGCMAYSFDPTMNTSDHVRKNGKGKFFNLGLSSFKGVKAISYEQRKERLGKFDRYVNIVNRLGLADKQIDFLKIDIEGSELDFFLDTASNHPELFKKIGQIQLEFHNLEECCHYHSGNRIDTTQFDMMKIVDILHCHGFALAHTMMNRCSYCLFTYHDKQRSIAYVTTWIRP